MPSGYALSVPTHRSNIVISTYHVRIPMFLSFSRLNRSTRATPTSVSSLPPPHPLEAWIERHEFSFAPLEPADTNTDPMASFSTDPLGVATQVQEPSPLGKFAFLIDDTDLADTRLLLRPLPPPPAHASATVATAVRLHGDEAGGVEEQPSVKGEGEDHDSKISAAAADVELLLHSTVLCANRWAACAIKG